MGNSAELFIMIHLYATDKVRYQFENKSRLELEQKTD